MRSAPFGNPGPVLITREYDQLSTLKYDYYSKGLPYTTGSLERSLEAPLKDDSGSGMAAFGSQLNRVSRRSLRGGTAGVKFQSHKKNGSSVTVHVQKPASVVKSRDMIPESKKITHRPEWNANTNVQAVFDATLLERPKTHQAMRSVLKPNFVRLIKPVENKAPIEPTLQKEADGSRTDPKNKIKNNDIAGGSSSVQVQENIIPSPTLSRRDFMASTNGTSHVGWYSRSEVAAVSHRVDEEPGPESSQMESVRTLDPPPCVSRLSSKNPHNGGQLASDCCRSSGTWSCCSRDHKYSCAKYLENAGECGSGDSNCCGSSLSCHCSSSGSDSGSDSASDSRSDSNQLRRRRRSPLQLKQRSAHLSQSRGSFEAEISSLKARMEVLLQTADHLCATNGQAALLPARVTPNLESSFEPSGAPSPAASSRGGYFELSRSPRPFASVDATITPRKRPQRSPPPPSHGEDSRLMLPRRERFIVPHLLPWAEQQAMRAAHEAATAERGMPIAAGEARHGRLAGRLLAQWGGVDDTDVVRRVALHSSVLSNLLLDDLLMSTVESLNQIEAVNDTDAGLAASATARKYCRYITGLGGELAAATAAQHALAGVDARLRNLEAREAALAAQLLQQSCAPPPDKGEVVSCPAISLVGLETANCCSHGEREPPAPIRAQVWVQAPSEVVAAPAALRASAIGRMEAGVSALTWHRALTEASLAGCGVAQWQLIEMYARCMRV